MRELLSPLLSPLLLAFNCRTSPLARQLLTRTLAIQSRSGQQQIEQELSTDLLSRVRRNDQAGGTLSSASLPFVVGGETYGNILPLGIAVLSEYGAPYVHVGATAVELDDTACSLAPPLPFALSKKVEQFEAQPLFEERSAGLAALFERLRLTGAVPMLDGWRDEPFAVRKAFNAPAACIVERAAAPLLGLPAYGVFATGYICGIEGSRQPTDVWIGRRSPNKPTWPGKLDSIAAGGLAAGDLPLSAMRSECADEAGIRDVTLLENLHSCSCLSYQAFRDGEWGLKPDILFAFDLELPPDFIPYPVDGEVEDFRLMSIEELIGSLRADNDDWKPNVGVVLIDFLLRHGFVNADDSDFLELVSSLRTGTCR